MLLHLIDNRRVSRVPFGLLPDHWVGVPPAYLLTGMGVPNKEILRVKERVHNDVSARVPAKIHPCAKEGSTIGHFRTPTSRTIGHPINHHWTLSERRFKTPLDTYAGFWYSGVVNTSRNSQGRFSRKLDAKDIAAIRAMHAEGASIREIADFLSLPKSTVHWTLKQDESAPAE